MWRLMRGTAAGALMAAAVAACGQFQPPGPGYPGHIESDWLLVGRTRWALNW